MPPEVPVKLLKAEIGHLFHVVEEPLLQYSDGVLNRALVFRFPHLGRQDDGVVVLSPFGVVLVQFRRDPVLVGNNGLFAVIADNQRRNTSKILQRAVVDLDPLRFLGRDHPFGVDVLRIRKDGDKDDNLH